MELQHINARELRMMLEHAAQRIQESEARLNALDAAIGDGDHGITMRVGFAAVQEQLSAMPEGTPISDVLQKAGNVFMDSTGGAIGVILGQMLMIGGKSLTNVENLGSTDFRTLLVAMESGAVKVGKARPGDKTIVDALHAAIEALTPVPAMGNLTSTFLIAAQAAEAAAQKTARLRSRIGRASRLGDRSVGHPDPGAVSLGIILRAMSDWMNNRRSQERLIKTREVS